MLREYYNHLESETVDPDDGHALMKFGKVVFVDLAGSERLKDSKSQGDRATETGSINKSLFTLGKVISALSDNVRKKKQNFEYQSNFVPASLRLWPPRIASLPSPHPHSNCQLTLIQPHE